MSGALPEGWVSAPLSALGTWLGGGTPSKAVPEYWTDGTIPWVSPKDMKRLLIDSAQDQITDAALRGSATNLVPARSVLMVTRSGILEHTFPVSVNAVPVTINQDLKAWTPCGVDSLYAAYYLRSRQQDVLRECSKDGTTVSSIDFDQLAKFPMLVAPRAEQQRIVSRIEELFSEIDEGERALERVGRLVERYRQSVLKAAVTGELTREWREGRDLQEWSSAPIHELGTVITGNTPPTNEPDNYGEGLPFLKPTDLDQGYELTEFRQALTARGQQYCRPLKANAVLVTCIGATIGKLGLARMPCATNQQINAVEVDAARVRAKFLFWCLASPLGQRAIIGGASATTLPILNKSRFQSIEVPLPTLDEQDVLVSLIEQHMDQAARAMTTVAIEARRLGALRQSILKAAFSGQLVPQDPRDEPASALLARLSAQAADAPATPRRRGRPAGRRASPPNPSLAP